MRNVPEDIKENLVEAVAPGLFSTLTAIRTVFETGEEIHRGTGLLLSYGDNNTYCLTANHVMHPHLMRPIPDKRPVKAHYHSERLRKDTNAETIYLRKTTCENPVLDIALAESALSGTDFSKPDRAAHYAFEHLKLADRISVLDDDVLLIAGLPSAKTTPLLAMNHTNHGAFFYLFTGERLMPGDIEHHRIEVPYDTGVAADGLSGAPVWQIRQQGMRTALDPNYIRRTNPSDYKLAASFCGMVVTFNPSPDNTLGILHPTACATFISKAEERLNDMRIEEEDKVIDERLAGRRVYDGFRL